MFPMSRPLSAACLELVRRIKKMLRDEKLNRRAKPAASFCGLWIIWFFFAVETDLFTERQQPRKEASETKVIRLEGFRDPEPNEPEFRTNDEPLPDAEAPTLHINLGPPGGRLLEQRQLLFVGCNRSLSFIDRLRVQLASGHIRRLAVISPNASALRVHVTGLDAPPGARLLIFGPKGEREVYFGRGPFDDGELWSGVIAGDTVFLEWSGTTAPPFHIRQVAHFWKWPYMDSVNLPETNPLLFEDAPPEADSVARLVYQTAFGPSMCAGILVNTQAQDGAPLLITAAHCIEDEKEARSVQVFWRYRAPKPGGAEKGAVASPPGARIVAVSVLADQTVLEILGVVPPGLYYSGWTTEVPPVNEKIFALHHPRCGAPPVNPEMSFLRLSRGVVNEISPDFMFARSARFVKIKWDEKAPYTYKGSSGGGVWLKRGNATYLLGIISKAKIPCIPKEHECKTMSFLLRRFARDAVLGFGRESISLEARNGNGTPQTALPVGAPFTLHKQLLTRRRAHWFAIDLPEEGVLTATTRAATCFGAVGVELYTPDGAKVTVGDRLGDHETLCYTNRGRQARFLVRVFLRNDTRNSYDLTIEVEKPHKLAVSSPGAWRGRGHGATFLNGRSMGTKQQSSRGGR